MERVLNIAVLLGTTRVHGPPAPNMGARVSAFITRQLVKRGYQISVIDPIVEKLPLLEKPHFSYNARDVPAQLQQLADRLSAADAYICITPEYNHSPSPALLNILNHFGSSTFSFKPSLIVSYSAGQWGGVRAAHALRPTLSELGCLPVSAMIHIPNVGDAFDEKGLPGSSSKEASWESYAARGLSQLDWWGNAACKHRQLVNPNKVSPAFKTSPRERNAP